jgi:tRNA 2-selenouridine synthase
MIERTADIDAKARARHDAIIDVRSPAEFADDRIPGAINLPVLSNSERAEVGTIYTQESRFKARRVGAALVARNVAGHLAGALADKPAKYRPLVYCWRGGMRSHAMATILSEIGWRVSVLDGGYKTWRRKVVAELHDSGAPLKIILIDGQTGTAKSRILARVAALGVQTIDLEAIANHRGSVFGATERAQPAQRLFESELWRAVESLDSSKPIIVEAESSTIGRCVIPRRLWREMLAAPRIVLKADAAVRADYLTRAYADLIIDGDALERAITRLKPFHGKDKVEEWLGAAGEKRFAELAASLMREHYDPLYDRGRKRRNDAPLRELQLDGLADSDLEAAARRIAQIAGDGAKARSESQHRLPSSA